MTRPALHPQHGLDAREQNLPSWAREKLSSLRRRVSELERMLAERDALILGANPDTNTFVHRYDPPSDFPLPTNSTIKFRTGVGVRDYILADMDSMGGITIRAANGNLRIVPNSSDSITINPRW